MHEAEFDRVAEEYEAQHAASIRLSGEDPAFFARYKIEDVATTLSQVGRQPRRILDFGGGIGNSLPFIRSSFPQSTIVLLDPSAKSLELARQRYPEMAVFQHFNGAAVPFPDDSFDLVFAACVFHHIPTDGHVPLLREIRRVTAGNGDLFVFEHNPYNPLTVQAVHDCPFDENAVLINGKEMRRRIREAGFGKAVLRFRIFFPRQLRRLRRLERLLHKVPLGAQYFVHAVNCAG